MRNEVYSSGKKIYKTGNVLKREFFFEEIKKGRNLPNYYYVLLKKGNVIGVGDVLPLYHHQSSSIAAIILYFFIKEKG